MTRNQILMGVGSVGAVAAIAMAGSAAVLADSENGQNGLAQRIAQKFNLNQADVEAVIQEEHQARHEERLDQLVSDGKITEEQKNLILQKQSEWQAAKPDFSSMTQEERKDAMDEHRAEMEKWAEENGIDLSVLGGPREGHGGKGMHGRMADADD